MPYENVLGNFSLKVSSEDISNQQFGTRVHTKLLMALQ
jgi:hypothetical protein